MKRAFDVAISAVGLILLLVPLVCVAVCVRIKLGSPIFFRQTRPGRHGVPFQLIKFRTMTQDRGSNGELLPDAERLTKFGRMLRQTSLDELPELWNVLKGEMSLVGPRPLVTAYLQLYSPEQARRHEVRPGVTGIAQISGRNEISWRQKFELDIWYVDNRTFMLDMKILALTVVRVLARSGVMAEGQNEVESFDGRN